MITKSNTEINKEIRENRSLNSELLIQLAETHKEIKETKEENEKLKKELVELKNKYNLLVESKIDVKAKELPIKKVKNYKNYRTNKYIRMIKDTLEECKYYDTNGYEYLDGIGIQNIRDIVYEALTDVLNEEE